jgi:23S rRNA (cytidine1920-2'-O)/16S rRNA (cytidine1409-2'-O)-methyltransferase
MTGSRRIRLDQLLVERGLVTSRSLARSLVMAGLVRVDGAPVDKAGAQVRPEAALALKERPRFVSRAGEKLAHALDSFSVDVRGLRALDIGSSTGGFVDCLLKAGAAEVVAVDVGYGQLDASLRTHERVHVLERTNARYLTVDLLPYRADVLTADVSFISLEKVLPSVLECMQPRFSGLLLVKPQFEAGPRNVGRGGIVRAPEIHCEVLRRLGQFLTGGLGLAVRGVIDSGLPGVGGNVEFFFWVERGGGEGLSPDNLELAIERAATPPHGPADRGEGGTDG